MRRVEGGHISGSKASLHGFYVEQLTRSLIPTSSMPKSEFGLLRGCQVAASFDFSYQHEKIANW